MGAGIGYQAVFEAPDGASLFPPTGLPGIDLALRNFLRRDWVLGFDVAVGSADGVAALPTVTAPLATPGPLSRVALAFLLNATPSRSWAALAL